MAEQGILDVAMMTDDVLTPELENLRQSEPPVRQRVELSHDIWIGREETDIRENGRPVVRNTPSRDSEQQIRQSVCEREYYPDNMASSLSLRPAKVRIAWLRREKPIMGLLSFGAFRIENRP